MGTKKKMILFCFYLGFFQNPGEKGILKTAFQKSESDIYFKSKTKIKIKNYNK